MQYTISILLVVCIAIVCFPFREQMGYKVVAFALLVAVSLLAMFFDILPVLTAAVLSALTWNFFFIPPLFTFHIGSAEDTLMFLMYFIIALVNTVLTFKIREQAKKARDREEKENAIRLYNTLFSSLSHELKTPIATIIGAVDTLKENLGTLSQENKTRLLSEIDIASTRLNRQVENLLNMSRLETGMLKLKLDWHDINELVHSAIRKTRDRNGHTMRFIPNDDLPLFRLDGMLIEEALHNIIHNGVLYTPEGSVIHVSTLYDNDRCVVTISDNGPGFNAPDMVHVFDKFYRSPQSKAGGTGLGLSIAKGFVEAHRGTIVLENNPTGGARFTISIPAETSFIQNLKHE